MFVLFTDTDSDITLEIAERYGYNIISMPYVLNGEEVYPFEDFKVFDCKGFYDKLRAGAVPKTFSISPEKYVGYFEPFFKEGKDILYVHFSPYFSSTFNAMNLALNELKEKYPERKFYTLDTKTISINMLIILEEIGEMYKAGKSVEEILEWGEKEVDKFKMFLFPKDLNFFKRSGRVSNISAIIGNVLGILPIISVNSEGVMSSVDKARGQKATVCRIIEKMKELIEDADKHKILVGHADQLETANFVVEKIKEAFGNVKTEIVEVTPTVGSHCGPDTVGVAFHSKHR